ncbi:hypothetical protein MELA_02803 [Candidatus Methylomirabilis lanthanidiphila]|uniref:DUF192 domain-containing protein n=1 Tax=Candidatus Methylomirabilis lanthanidiphila TaxID=2211376 RepID=A0A564ZM50_9BACT|nr:DUF192 domain-containing protein [Candidatus Methylomirabilis lanthanidiphila]VUZ86400.1 hypothetical protein MELA_02803 [Candidatus Methylomirabilis lanthanidiphila]
MRAARNYAVLGFLLLLPFTLGVLLVSDVLALQRGDVVIDGRVTITVEVAQTAREQARGLGGRSSLSKGSGMLFPFDAADLRTFWMKGMLIPLDIVWIREGKIVAIDASVPPPRSHESPAVVDHVADLVLEVPAGFAAEMGISPGQMVRVTYEGSSR